MGFRPYESEDSLYFGFLEIKKVTDKDDKEVYELFTPSYFIHHFNSKDMMVAFFECIIKTVKECDLNNIPDFRKGLEIEYRQRELEKLKNERQKD